MLAGSKIIFRGPHTIHKKKRARGPQFVDPWLRLINWTHLRKKYKILSTVLLKCFKNINNILNKLYVFYFVSTICIYKKCCTNRKRTNELTTAKFCIMLSCCSPYNWCWHFSFHTLNFCTKRSLGLLLIVTYFS